MGESLRVAVVSKALAPGGGACRMADRLAELLRGAGHTAHNWVGFYTGPPREHVLQLHGHRSRSLVRAVHRGTARLGFQEIIPLEYLVFRNPSPGYDIIHVHDIIGTASPLTVGLFTKVAPVAVTMHDCSHITGGCISPHECRSYPDGCRDCPERRFPPLRGLFDATSAMRGLRRRLWRNPGIHFAAPSRWMIDQARASRMVPGEIAHIPNCVETDLFSPVAGSREKDALRKQLGLPLERRVVVMSSGSLEDRYKGIALGIEALRRCEAKPFVLFIGNDAPSGGSLIGLEHAATGYIHDRRQMADYLKAGDLFVHPTLRDNQPLVTLEALAAGVPVAAFDTGGIGEYIENGRNGYLVETGDSAALGREVARALQDPDRLARMGREAVATAADNFTEQLFLDRHLRFYRDILERRGRP